jgi:hypothetical protein
LVHDLEDADVLSSVRLVLEAKRHLVRLARGGLLAPEQYDVWIDRVDQDAGAFTLRDLTRDLCESSLMPAVVTPR